MTLDSAGVSTTPGHSDDTNTEEVLWRKEKPVPGLVAAVR